MGRDVEIADARTIGQRHGNRRLQASLSSAGFENVRDGAGTGLGITYVAEADGKLVAMTGIYRSDGIKMRHRATIWGVYACSDWRGLGIADALIAACVGWARAQQLRLVTLSVVTTNAAAIRCYVRCGFSVYGMDPEVIYHDDVYYDELLMVHKL